MIKGVKMEKSFHYKSCADFSNKQCGLIALLHGYWCKKEKKSFYIKEATRETKFNLLLLRWLPVSNDGLWISLKIDMVSGSHLCVDRVTVQIHVESLESAREAWAAIAKGI